MHMKSASYYTLVKNLLFGGRYFIRMRTISVEANSRITIGTTIATLMVTGEDVSSRLGMARKKEFKLKHLSC